jgi:dipeptidyl aminopeptidase/acylaminoacyl peptidase
MEYGALAAESPVWSPDSQTLCYRMKTSGTWQVWSWNRDEGKPYQLTHAKGDVENYGWISNGTKILLTVKKPNDPEEAQRISEHGILYDGVLNAGSSTLVMDRLLQLRPSETEVWIHDAISGDERRATEQEIALRDVEGGDLKRRIFSQGDLEKHDISDLKISPDGRYVAYKKYFSNPADFKNPTIVLFSKPVRGGTPVQISPGVPDMSQFWWNGDSARIYYMESDVDGRPARLMVAAVADGIVRPVYSGPEWLEGYSESQGGHYVACKRQTGITPPQVALLDLENGVVRVLADINPEFKNLNLSSPTRIEGTNKYGDHWFAHVVKPINFQLGHQYPLIITTYRSGDDRFLRGGTGDEYPIQVFAALGFVVLSFDTGTDRNFIPGDFSGALLQWASPVASIEMAVKDLSERGVVDPKNVALTGLSHGAEIVEYAISHTGFLRTAIESGGGARDPYFYYMGGKAWEKIFSEWGLGGWPEGISRANWQVLSPLLNADHVSAPLLSNAAESEYVWGLPLIVSLRQLGRPVELFIYPNEHHIKNQPKHRYEIYERNVDWVRFWLLDEEAADPAKRDEYARWRELRKLQEQKLTPDGDSNTIIGKGE